MMRLIYLTFIFALLAFTGVGGARHRRNEVIQGHTELFKDETITTDAKDTELVVSDNTEVGGGEGEEEEEEMVQSEPIVINLYGCSSDNDCASISEGQYQWTCDTEIAKCVDCMEVVGGSTMEDICGTCDGDSSSCSDCNGDPFGSANIDACGSCVEGNTGKETNYKKDDCGVCNGQNLDKDDCDVCFGNNRDKDCTGVCFGETFADHCGDCGGTNECCKTSIDGQLCNDHGACDGSINACACDFGWTGPLCSLAVSYCHDASGEVALVDCGDHGICNEARKGSCVCDEGYYGPGCGYKTCSGNGIYSPSMKACMCAAGFGGVECNRCAVPGETRALQEMFYKLLQEEISAVTVTFGISSTLDASSANALTGNPPNADDKMAYMCIPPRVYTQKFFDSITVMSSNGKVSTSDGVERLLVDYMLIPVPKKLEGPYLSGRRAIVQGIDAKPVLPNTTHDGVFYDCGCKAWPAEMVRVIEESEDVQARWMGSPAPNALHGRSRITRSTRGAAMSERAVVNETECVDLLDQCLDVLSSMVSAETGTADEIGTAIDKGDERHEFIGNFMIGLVVSIAVFVVLAIGSMFAGIYTITLAIHAIRGRDL
ncbi:MAG: hypothetical protein ACTSUE_20060 [Promethearchaeota archaeon]